LKELGFDRAEPSDTGPGGDKSIRPFNGIYKTSSAVDYYEGE